MKKILIFILVLTYYYSFGQISFESFLVTENTELKPISIFSADLDNDGDLDIFAAFRGVSPDYIGKITWYENLDGIGNFGSQQLLSNVNDAVFINTISFDADNDGDIDILVTTSSNSQNKIFWYENLDGNGNFGTEQIIEENINSNRTSIFASDIDGDNLMDVISSSTGSHPDYNGTISLYKNIGGNFSSQQIIRTNLEYAYSTLSSDIDNDGDKDIVSFSKGDYPTYNGEISWYENQDGNGTFSSEQILATPSDNINSFLTFDIDGDNDIDILTLSGGIEPNNIGELVWYENLDSNGNFSEKQVINGIVKEGNDIIINDLNNDGNLDIIFTSGNGEGDVDGKIAWHENINNEGSFGSEQIIINLNFNWTGSHISIDINGDTKNDIAFTYPDSNKIIWLKNLDTNLSITGISLFKFSVFPTPTESILNIMSKTEITKIEVYNKLGKLILKNTTENKIDISNLSQGLYFIKVEDINGNFGVKKIVKK